MTERALANKLRLQIIEQIAKVDLPWFLFEEIDQSLVELNYYKLSNLFNNLPTYTQYLEEIQAAYTDFLKHHNPLMRAGKLPMASYEPYITDQLYMSNYQLYFNARELLKIKSLFSVSCILRMKEFINRRILQKSELHKKSASANR